MGLASDVCSTGVLLATPGFISNQLQEGEDKEGASIKSRELGRLRRAPKDQRKRRAGGKLGSQEGREEEVRQREGQEWNASPGKIMVVSFQFGL